MCEPFVPVDQYANDLESGDQLICMKGSCQNVASANFLSDPPNAGTTNIPLLSCDDRAKAICVPSGDQAGLIQRDGWSASLIIRSEPIVFTYKSNPLLSSLLQANAIW